VGRIVSWENGALGIYKKFCGVVMLGGVGQASFAHHLRKPHLEAEWQESARAVRRTKIEQR